MKKRVLISAIAATAACFTFAACSSPDNGPSHSHSFGTSWEFDESQHYYECECGEKSDAADHTPGEWVIDVQASATEDGLRHKNCSVCDYKVAEETIHTFTAENHAGKYLAAAATLENAATYYYSCVVCGTSEENAEHVFSYGDPLEPSHAHSFTTVASDETHHWYVCDVSGCGEIKPNSKVPHESQTWTDAGSGKHSGACAVCSKPVTEDHTPGDWTDDNGTHKKLCTECDALTDSHAEDVETWHEVTGEDRHSGECKTCGITVKKAHTYTEVQDSKYFVSESGGVVTYYKSCACGKASSETFNVASHTHNSDTVNHDETNHWQECSVCGKDDDSTKGPHTYDEDNGWHNTVDATYDSEGTEANTCTYTGCGYEKTRPIPKLVDKGFLANGFRVDTENGTAARVNKKEDANGLKVTMVNKTDDWHVKIHKDITCEDGASYEYSYTFTSSVAGIEIGLEVAGTPTQSITTVIGENTVTLNFTANGTNPYNCLKLGNLPNGEYVVITDMKLVKAEGETRTTVAHWIADPDCVHNHTAGGTPTDDGDGNHSTHCTECGEATSTEAHTPGTPTDNGDGTHTSYCTACGAVTSSAAHTVDTWTPVTGDDANHSGACSACSATVTEAHTWTVDEQTDENGWKVTTPAQESAPGEKQRTCSKCSHVETETIPALSHTHSYGTEWTNDENQHWHECSCGDKSETADHIATDWTRYDDTHHYATCSVCGNEFKKEHTFGEWENVVEATYDKAGSEKRTCACGKENTRTIPMLVDKGFVANGFGMGWDNDVVRADYAETAAGYEITINNTDNTDWHIKFQKTFATEAGKTYAVTFMFTSTQSGDDLVKIEMGSGATVIGNSDRYKHVDSVNRMTGTFTAAGTETYICLQLGKLNNDTKIVVTDVLFAEVSDVAAPSAVNVDNLSIGANHDAAKLDATITGGRVDITMKDSWTAADPWNARACLSTGVNIIGGRTYTVTAKVSGLDDGEEFDLKFRKGADWTGDYCSTHVTKDADSTEKNITLTFTAGDTAELFVWLEVGKLGANASVTLSDITITETTSTVTNNHYVTSGSSAT